LSDEELLAALREDPDALGSMSIGQPNSGALYGAVPLSQEDERWVVVDPTHAYGTRETIDFLESAVARVAEQFPNTPPLHIGHISARRGGHLSPHRSHQSGRDVDVGYYYQDGSEWYARATAGSLDVRRTWALVRALITQTDVYFILMDHSVQALLRKHALAIGEDPEWLDDVFEGKQSGRALIRHVRGHATHMHVRFYNPIAEESARRCYKHLVALNLIKPPTHFVQHKVKKGDTLIGLAKRYGTTVKAIKRANGLRSNKIFARKTYKIPRKGPAAAPAPMSVPPRRLPPGEQASAPTSSQAP
jgi:penicillin-insensitive murein endopeptidase